MCLPSGDSVLVSNLSARRTVVLCLRSTLARPSMAALQDTPVCTLLRLYGCTVLDDALLYLSAVVLRVHDTASN